MLARHWELKHSLECGNCEFAGVFQSDVALEEHQMAMHCHLDQPTSGNSDRKSLSASRTISPAADLISLLD